MVVVLDDEDVVEVVAQVAKPVLLVVVDVVAVVEELDDEELLELLDAMEEVEEMLDDEDTVLVLEVDVELGGRVVVEVPPEPDADK